MKQQQHHFLSTRPIQNEIKISFISEYTQYGQVIMGNAFVRMSYFECRAPCTAADWPCAWAWDRTKATATNDPYVRGNYRKCAYSV